MVYLLLHDIASEVRSRNQVSGSSRRSYLVYPVYGIAAYYRVPREVKVVSVGEHASYVGDSVVVRRFMLQSKALWIVLV